MSIQFWIEIQLYNWRHIIETGKHFEIKSQCVCFLNDIDLHSDYKMYRIEIHVPLLGIETAWPYLDGNLRIWNSISRYSSRLSASAYATNNILRSVCYKCFASHISDLRLVKNSVYVNVFTVQRMLRHSIFHFCPAWWSHRQHHVKFSYKMAIDFSKERPFICACYWQ